MSSREIQRHNKTVLDSLEKGDVVEIDRGLYYHYAVYDGNGGVIHRSGVDDGPMRSRPEHASTLSGKKFDKGIVRKEKLRKVVGDSKMYKNNSKDEKFPHFRKGEIVRRASSQVGDVGYNLLWQNCEHFASDCRYGRKESGQADILIAGVAAVGAVVAGFGLWWWWRGGQKE